MRFFWAIITALLLAACQQPGAAPPSPSEPPSQASGLGSEAFGGKSGGEMRYFKPEGDALIKQLAVNLLEACYDKLQARDQDGFHRCLRDRMTVAFDDSHQGRAACDHYGEIDAYTDCLVVGNMVLQMRRQLDDDSPVTAGFWASKDAMIHAMIKSVVIGATANCGAEPSESAALSCADHWLAERLEIPADLMKRCEANSKSDQREACLGEAVTLQYMRTHMDRIRNDTI